MVVFAAVTVPSWLEDVFRHSELTDVGGDDGWWTFRFGDHCTVSTDGLWRLVVSDRLAVTSEDHGHIFGRDKPTDAREVATRTLTGPVLAARVLTATADLIIEFQSGRLELINTSGGYEGWRVQARVDGDDVDLIAVGGGTLAAPEGQRR
jgi:hypothetical protein